MEDHMLLLEHPLSPYAQKVKIALREKQIPFESQTPEGLGSGKTTGDYAIETLRGEVPVLIDGDSKIFDSTIILEYIEQKWPEPRLLPADPFASAQARMIEDVMDTHYEAINWGLGEIHWFGRAEGQLRDDIMKTAAKQISGFHAWLESQIKPSGWFTGEDFGWTDLSVVPYINCSALFGFAPPENSRLASWLAAANARPTVAETQSEALSAATNMGAYKDALLSGQLRREYRDHRLEWMMKSGGLPIVLAGVEHNNIRFSVESFD
jgi:glutathione S-transferase